MKKVLLPLALMIMGVISPTITTSAETLDAAADSGNPIILIKKGVPNNPFNPKSLIPQFVPCQVNAWLVDGFLRFESNRDIYDVEVSIYDEEGVNVSCSVVDVLTDDSNSYDINFLSSGYYTLNVTINGVEYYAYFDM